MYRTIAVYTALLELPSTAEIAGSTGALRASEYILGRHPSSPYSSSSSVVPCNSCPPPLLQVVAEEAISKLIRIFPWNEYVPQHSVYTQQMY